MLLYELVNVEIPKLKVKTLMIIYQSQGFFHLWPCFRHYLSHSLMDKRNSLNGRFPYRRKAKQSLLSYWSYIFSCVVTY